MVAGRPAGAAVAVRPPVLALRQIVLYALLPAAIRGPVARHGHLGGLEVGLALLRVRKGVGLAVGPGLLERHLAPDVAVLIRAYHVGVECQHVVVADAVGNAVAVQLVAEHVGGSVLLLLVLVLDGRAGKAKQHRRGEGPPDGLHHVAEG